MGSPQINFKISKTTGPIPLKFAGQVDLVTAYWSIKYRDCGLKLDGERQ